MTLTEIYEILKARAYNAGEREKLIAQRATAEKNLERINLEIIDYDNKIAEFEKRASAGCSKLTSEEKPEK